MGVVGRQEYNGLFARKGLDLLERCGGLQGVCIDTVRPFPIQQFLVDGDVAAQYVGRIVAIDDQADMAGNVAWRIDCHHTTVPRDGIARFPRADGLVCRGEQFRFPSLGPLSWQRAFQRGQERIFERIPVSWTHKKVRVR